MEDEYMTELKSIENNAKYKTLINYLKIILEKNYVDKNEILTILKALEEVE